MDIDTLIKSGCKRHRISTRVMCINLSSEEGESGIQLEHRRKRNADCGGPTAVVNPIFFSFGELANSCPSKLTHYYQRRHPLPPVRGNSLVAPTIKRDIVKAVEDFPSFLCHLLSEVGALGLRYTEARNKELVDI